MFGNIHVVKTVSVLDILIFLQNCGLSSPLAGGYWEFHRGKPVPFGNRVPSWIFEVRALGYERVSAKIAHFVNSLPGPDLVAQIEEGDLITNSGFFDHPAACVQAKGCSIQTV